MKVLGEKRGKCWTLICDNCDCKTGYLYIIEKKGRASNICTTCKADMNTTA